MTKTSLVAALLVSCATVYGQPQVTIGPGTQIPIRTNESIDVRDAADGRVYTGVVARDVLDPEGRIAIAHGSPVELMVRDIGRHTLALDLESVSVEGRRYSVAAYDVTRSGKEKDGIGANGRTGKFVGGGALFGTIVGAIAGGGKGAAIGALAGGAAGAGGELATRGARVRIPVESLITFQLRQPLTVVEDRGYTRDGHHYHDYDRR